ncbi:hypothetical protein [Bifidobacterium moraviense]|uniref:hypothetical protein n=1 Tax=Bifidobacterium moraviense TaxID=2675323 RepID=UPI00145EB7EB|nr:hypothetical protein [Bifidobacterium sp. DSM 109958]
MIGEHVIGHGRSGTGAAGRLVVRIGRVERIRHVRCIRIGTIRQIVPRRIIRIGIRTIGIRTIAARLGFGAVFRPGTVAIGIRPGTGIRAVRIRFHIIAGVALADAVGHDRTAGRRRDRFGRGGIRVHGKRSGHAYGHKNRGDRSQYCSDHGALIAQPHHVLLIEKQRAQASGATINDIWGQRTSTKNNGVSLYGNVSDRIMKRS